MQIFAYSNQGKLVRAGEARKKESYSCLGCGQSVHLRSGSIRAPHFYHFSKKRCHLSRKSAAHLQAQYRLARLIPTCKLEHRFPSINRIADAYWPEEKLIFEVQCSPITAKEVSARNRDYEALGLTVIWIFHERRFGRRIPPCPFYYMTNINPHGHGAIFDRDGPISFPLDLKKAKPQPKRRPLHTILRHMVIEFFC